MSISLSPKQERLIQTKLQTGKYNSAEEVLEIALRLLDKYDLADAAWIEDVGEKIDQQLAHQNKHQLMERRSSTKF